ncbi:MAG: acetate/propionate family kinase, partial [Clostridia bacterium]|nr:acetate/propionate family kinase [Clostridia bacterium]
TMKKEVYLYPIPYEAYTDWKIRKYGFHGTSHKFVSGEMARILGRKLKDLKIITIHLGNGSSMTAIKDGKSVDTSMGFTPVEGLMMGTRCGDIDATIPSFIAEKLKLKNNETIDYLNKKCGIMGISGVSSDMRDVNKAAAEGNERAKLIVPMLAYRIKKYIGAYVAAMNGVDAIVFTGGIGEHQEDLRDMVMRNMDYFGIDFDFEKNKIVSRGTIEELTKPESKVKVFRIPTDEELVIARDTINLVS